MSLREQELQQQSFGKPGPVAAREGCMDAARVSPSDRHLRGSVPSVKSRPTGFHALLAKEELAAVRGAYAWEPCGGVFKASRRLQAVKWSTSQDAGNPT